MNNMHPQSGRLYTMCGIAAVSRGIGSTINMREVAHALLTQIENRGTHASGFAFYGANGEFGFYKNPKPGSQLSLAELPRDAQTVILHTRYATQGKKEDNRNNHPVLSTDNQVALVHNGVISNDFRLRTELGITREEHGDVDSLVIPSLIAQRGVESLSELAGYAAVAWLDGNEDGQLHIARLKSSPVAYTHLLDGTFAMASTEALLEDALDSISQPYGGVFELDEGRMIEVDLGFIVAHEKAPSMSYDYQAYGRYSGATAGGHKTTTKAGSVTTVTPPKPAKGSEDSCELTVENYYEDLEQWREAQGKKDKADQGRAMVMFDDPNDPYDYSDVDNAVIPQDGYSEAQWDELVSRMEREEEEELIRRQEAEDANYEYLAGEGYYIIDHDGGASHYPTLDDLEGGLRWAAKMARGEWDLFDVEDDLNWVNNIMDVGAVSEDGDLVSWVDDSADIDSHESPSVRNLQHIREGVHLLERLRGA